MAKRYVYAIDPEDRAQICDAELGQDDASALDALVDHEFLSLALLRLKPREEHVIRLRYGIGGLGEATYKEIGDDLGLSVQSIRQIHTKSLRKLRWHARRYYPEKPIEENLARERHSAQAARARNPARARPIRSRSVPARTQHYQCTRREREPNAPSITAARPQVRVQERHTPRADEPKVTGAMLSLATGCLLVALGIDPVIAFNLTKAVGVAATLSLHLIAAMSGLMSIIFLVSEMHYPAEHLPNLEKRWPAAQCALLVTLSIACLSPPVQQSLQHMVAATPARYSSPLPAIATFFAVVIGSIGSGYLVAHWDGRHARFDAGHLKS